MRHCFVSQTSFVFQYPGVSRSIDSDINNLISVLSVWNILPEAMYVDNVMKVARRELAWECDYNREAECSTKFRYSSVADSHFWASGAIQYQVQGMGSN